MGVLLTIAHFCDFVRISRAFPAHFPRHTETSPRQSIIRFPFAELIRVARQDGYLEYEYRPARYRAFVFTPAVPE